MGKNILDNGNKEKDMEEVNGLQEKEMFMLGTGKMEKQLVKDNL